MASTINADNGAVSGTAGLKSSSDGTGILALQTNGTTAVTVDASQNVTLAGTLATSLRGITKASMPASTVLQVINFATSTYNNTSGTTFIDTNITATITPTSNTSKILVLVSHNASRKTNNTSLSFQLLRGASVILTFEAIGGYTNNTNTNSFSSSCCYLDSPATTSATTYKTQFCSNVATNLVEVQAGASSTITLMEIAQ